MFRKQSQSLSHCTAQHAFPVRLQACLAAYSACTGNAPPRVQREQALHARNQTVHCCGASTKSRQSAP